MDVDNLDGSWLEGTWKLCLKIGGGVGPTYLPGGSRGSPYHLKGEE